MVKYAAMKPIAIDAHDFPSLRRDGGIYVDKDDVCLCRGGTRSGNLVSLLVSPIVSNFRKSVLFVAAVAMALAVPTEVFGFSVPDKDGFSFNVTADCASTSLITLLFARRLFNYLPFIKCVLFTIAIT